MTWGQISGDSLNVVFSTGYGGVKATLDWTGDRWDGAARTFRDFGPPFEFDAGSIELAPVSCDSPPPVPITRSVELEADWSSSWVNRFLIEPRATRGHFDQSPEARMRVRTIGRTIAPLLGAALTHTALPAQERASELTGCYDITVGDWIVDEPAPGQPRRPLPDETGDSTIFEMPPRIKFDGAFRDFDGRLTSRTRIVVPEGALPSVHGYMSGNLVGDTLGLSFSTVFAGVGGRLPPSGNGWAGTVFTHTDTGGWNRRPVKLTRVNCDSPPPVSIDAMRPLPRSVELEDGAVITLGKPVPRSLEMTPGRLRFFRVVGRTAGLFGTTDSISVVVGWDQEVRYITLNYPADHFERLAFRFRDSFGSHWRNRTTLLDLSYTRVGTTWVRLFDPWLFPSLKGPLARSVELEGGAVISLREPLPASLETAPPQPGRPLAVVGRTAGLFAEADSIAVSVNEQGTVRVVELFYHDADDYAGLQTRMRDVYGNPHRPRSDTVPEGVTYINPITEIRLTRWRESGAYIRLSDHRYR